jgi:RimJ/RimL family protein N-acetyltransferase
MSEVTLQTKRLLLRPLADADRAPMTEIMSDWDVVRMLAKWPFPFDPARLDQLFERNAKDPTSGFAIEYEGNCVGTIGCGPGVGFMLSPKVHGLGLMTEALGAVQDYSMSALGNEALIACAFIDNPASARVFEKCGWTEIGAGETFSLARGETVVDRAFVLSSAPQMLRPVHTERLTLRPIGIEDFEAIWPIVSDLETVKMLWTWPYPADETFTKLRISSAVARAGLISAIEYQGAVVGQIGVLGGSLWYALRRQFWGKGIGTEAARAKIASAFQDPKRETLIAGTWDDNPASMRILERLGFEQTGYDTVYHEARGEVASGPDYELTREKWLAMH